MSTPEARPRIVLGLRAKMRRPSCFLAFYYRSLRDEKSKKKGSRVDARQDHTDQRKAARKCGGSGVPSQVSKLPCHPLSSFRTSRSPKRFRVLASSGVELDCFDYVQEHAALSQVIRKI